MSESWRQLVASNTNPRIGDFPGTPDMERGRTDVDATVPGDHPRYRLHRRLGLVTLVCASLVAVSTLFTKQHYIADVIAGILLAFAAYVLILRGYPRQNIPELDRRLAPMLALGVLAVVGLCVVGFWIAYQLQGQA